MEAPQERVHWRRLRAKFRNSPKTIDLLLLDSFADETTHLDSQVSQARSVISSAQGFPEGDLKSVLSFTLVGFTLALLVNQIEDNIARRNQHRQLCRETIKSLATPHLHPAIANYVLTRFLVDPDEKFSHGDLVEFLDELWEKNDFCSVGHAALANLVESGVIERI